MAYYVLEPEAAGGLGPRTVLDTAAHPPVVSRLHYEVEGWLGDDLLESTPCYLVNPAVGPALESAGVSGFELASAEVTVADDAQDVVDARVTTFCWLRPLGKPGIDDLGVAPDASLVVSDKALDVLNQFQLDHCDVSEYVV